MGSALSLDACTVHLVRDRSGTLGPGECWTAPGALPADAPPRSGGPGNSVLRVPLSAGGRLQGILIAYPGDRAAEVWGASAPGGCQLAESLAALAGALGDVLAICREIDRLRAQAQRARKTTLAAQRGEEAVRRRLAAEIHDGVAQPLVGLAYHVSAAAGQLPGDPQAAAALLERAGRLAEAAVAEVRAVARGLRPVVLDDLGLAAALSTLLRDLPVAGTTLDVDETITVPPEEATALYRIAQEALSNVVRHARASSVTLTLRRVGTRTVLRVSDDGVGFTPPRDAAGMGFAGMAQRAAGIGARLEVTSRPGAGTRISVWLAAQRG